MADARGVNVTEPVAYGFFKETGIELEKRFKRYLFARVEQFIAENTSMQMKQSLYDLVQNTGSKNGFHIVYETYDQRRDGIARNNLAKRWTGLSDDELICSDSFIQAVKFRS